MISPASRSALRERVARLVAETPVFDIHTHLYAPAFGPLLLWGIDELLTYHYLVAEVLRFQRTLPYALFHALPKTEQADLIWRTLFVERSPLSEACRGVVTTLHRLGFDPRKADLPALRRHFAGLSAEAHLDTCLRLAGVRAVCMTNSPFDEDERPVWETFSGDPRFQAALRIDPLLVDWERSGPRLAGWGYRVRPDLGGETLAEVARFLTDWAQRMKALYLMASLPPEFAFPAAGAQGRLLAEAVLPACADLGLPFALMLGVRRHVQPALGLAGDGVGRSDLSALERLCRDFPQNRFLATVLARENQHELCVLARKFRNLHPFGCWWFTNVPSVIDEMTRQRLELLGTSVTLQHSDARVLDQVVYKWDHARAVIGQALADKYEDLAASGWPVTDEAIRQDAHDLLGGAFEAFLQGE